MEGKIFDLARWFQAPVDASSKDDDSVRDEILNDLHQATAVGTHNGTVLALTPNGAAMMEKDDSYGVVVFNYVRHDRWGRTHFWMNTSSVKGLGDYLRSVPRRPFDEMFFGA